MSKTRKILFTQKNLSLLTLRYEVCPKCGSNRIRYSDSWIKNIKRFLESSRRRNCKVCGSKWSARISKEALEFRKKIILSFVFAIVALLFLCLWSASSNKTPGELEEGGNNVETQVDASAPLSS